MAAAELPVAVQKQSNVAGYRPRLKKRYEERVRNSLRQRFQYNNDMKIPKIEKVVINMGVGAAVYDRKKLDAAVEALARISGQKPVATKAKKSIAAFKLREGMAIGCKVTLRRDRMYEFLDRLVTIALPRQKDFKGLNGKSFDGRGNYNLGLKEHSVFPEVDYESIDHVIGMDVNICTTAQTDTEAKALLEEFDFPFGEDAEPKRKGKRRSEGDHSAVN